MFFSSLLIHIEIQNGCLMRNMIAGIIQVFKIQHQYLYVYNI